MAAGCMRDHEALVRALKLYDQARETFADSPTPKNGGDMAQERANLADRAGPCGWTDDHGDLIVWARRRAATYQRCLSAGVSELATAHTIGLIEMVESYLPKRGAA